MLALLCACHRPPDAPPESAAQSKQKLPFNRQPNAIGNSPSTLIPSSSQLPEGTPIVVRLRSTLSSAASHVGDTFVAVLDEPITVDGQTLVARGAIANGRVLEAKAFGNSLEPGYLRIVLVSLEVGGKRVMIYTSSIFSKGGPRDERSMATGMAAGSDQKEKDADKDIVFGTDRRLYFRLAQTVDLQ